MTRTTRIAAELTELLGTGLHPYANLEHAAGARNLYALLCSAGTPAMRKRWGVACTEPAQTPPNLLGKVVVIGAEDARDRCAVLGHAQVGI